MSNLIKVGKYNKLYNSILNTSYDDYDIFRDKGLISHLLKRNHTTALKHIDDIPDIISSPDYIGRNPNESNSIEFIKCYKRNMHLGIKIDLSKGYMYVATMHEITQSMIDRYVHSGRLKKIDNTSIMEYNLDDISDEQEKAPCALDNENLT